MKNYLIIYTDGHTQISASDILQAIMKAPEIWKIIRVELID